MSTPRTLDLPDHVRRLTIETRRGAFAALEALPGTGICERQAALLVPGFTGSKEDFLPVLQALAQAGRRVVAIDMRGQYETAGSDSPCAYSADELAADIAGIVGWLSPLDGDARPPGAAGYRRAHLLGHSFGGLVTQWAVLTQAVTVTSVTLMSSGPARLTGPRAAALRAMLGMIEAAAPARLGAEVERLWDLHMAPQAIADGVPGDIRAFLRERMLRNSPYALRAMAEALLTWPDRTRALASQASQPILVLYGEDDDAWSPAAQEGMARRLGAERVCIPGAAHSPAIEAPDTTARTLTAFWNAVEARQRRSGTARGGTSPQLAWRTEAAGSGP